MQQGPLPWWNRCAQGNGSAPPVAMRTRLVTKRKPPAKIGAP